MIIDKRLIGTVSESRKYIAGNVACQWGSLAANMAMMTALTSLIAALFTNPSANILWAIGVAAIALAVRFGCAIASARMSYLSSRAVKRTPRERIYEKLLRLGTSYREQAATSEVVQVAVEGADQLETYFGAYPSC